MSARPPLSAILSEVRRADDSELKGYLSGASRDATFNRLHNTMRFAQRDQDWLEVLRVAYARLGKRSWIYREGSRNVWVLECVGRVHAYPESSDVSAGIAWARGYFDAEGGIPKQPLSRFYIQMVQKNQVDLLKLIECLEARGISCGKLHNPSVRVDPDYWRFYVRAISIRRFVETVSSWHPAKRNIFGDWSAAGMISGLR
jgi:hypothetical protein